MSGEYIYFVNLNNEPFDIARIDTPPSIEVWWNQTHGATLALRGGRKVDAIEAVHKMYPDAQYFLDYKLAQRALLDRSNVVLQPIHLGQGAEGQRRKEALEKIAALAGYTWGGKPSIGRWLVALADKELGK